MKTETLTIRLTVNEKKALSYFASYYGKNITRAIKIMMMELIKYKLMEADDIKDFFEKSKIELINLSTEKYGEDRSKWPETTIRDITTKEKEIRNAEADIKEMKNIQELLFKE